MPLTTRQRSEAATDIPFPYTVPSVSGFRNFFYWDTYFANWGLLSMGMFSQAKNNLKNMAEFVRRYGYVPNADVLTNRSQPPLFTRAVYDYAEKSGDRAITGELLDAMVREHDFWMRRRTAPCGLARYGHEACKQELKDFNREIADRLKLLPEDMPDGEYGEDLISCAESGWDFSPRFFNGMRCVASSICPVDLNAILYDAEIKIGDFAHAEGKDKLSETFYGYAAERKRLMRELMYDPDEDLFLDYDFVRGKRRKEVAHAASFAAAAYGVYASPAGLSSLLPRLECEYGLTVCENTPLSHRFQWAYPFMWPPITSIVCDGLIAAGLYKDALRVMDKYCRTVERNFIRSGNLWEKYDAVSGEKGVSCEYETPPMLGWTTGVYLRFGEIKQNVIFREESK